MIYKRGPSGDLEKKKGTMIYKRQELQIYSIHRHTTSINKIKTRT